jgi:uncharacterized protein YgiM (DUF1202 family)
MKKSVSVMLTLTLFLISSVASSFAGARHYSSGYRNNFHSKSSNYHRPYYRGHYNNSNSDWTYRGIGLLTGAAVGSIVYQPHRQRRIVYNNSPPVIIQSAAVMVRPQYVQVPAQPELVLRRVRTTPELLNVRSAPDFSATISSQLQQDTVLDVLEVKLNWLYIRTSKREYGWIMSQYTQAAAGPVG